MQKPHDRNASTREHVDYLEHSDALHSFKIRTLTLIFPEARLGTSQATWELGGPIIIGRDPGLSGIEIPDPGSSRRHAEIAYDKSRGTAVIKDLGSRNGTFVDGLRTAETDLRHGSVIRVAGALLVYSEVDDFAGIARVEDEHCMAPARAVVEASAKAIAGAPLSVLLLGPTGAGKEVLARAIHAASGRTGRFVGVNCGALNQDLVTSEFFGHSAGAFSGANQDRPGLFVAANKGTLFLDEVADLPLSQQPVLLRALQERTVRPVGSDTEIPVDVRIICATHRPITQLVQEERFRRDLHARLAGTTLTVPGLSNRREEILYFFAAASELPLSAISPDAAEALVLHDWPENMRELQHLATRVRTYGPCGLELAGLPPLFARRLTKLRRGQQHSALAQQTVDRDELLLLLQEYRGNVAGIAKAVCKHRAQVYRWLRRERLNPEDYRGDDSVRTSPD